MYIQHIYLLEKGVWKCNYLKKKKYITKKKLINNQYLYSPFLTNESVHQKPRLTTLRLKLQLI